MWDLNDYKQGFRPKRQAEDQAGLDLSLEGQSGWSGFTPLENRCNQESLSNQQEWKLR